MNAFVVISKYYMLLLVMAFVLFSFIGNAKEGNDKKMKVINMVQWVLMILLYLSGYGVLGILYSYKYFVFCIVSLLIIIGISLLYNYVYEEMSKPLFNNMIMLIIIGLITLGRLDFSSCIKQFVFIAGTLFVGLFIPYIIARVKILDKLSIIYCVTGLMLLMVVFFFGASRNGAKNWLILGPVALQPSEFVKMLFIFAMAGFFAKNISLKRIVITTIIAGAYVLVLVAEKDLGGALIFFMTFLVILYIATNKKRYLAGGLAGFSLMCIVAYNIFAHVRIRVLAYLDPFAVIDNEGYQLAQSFFAIGTGGLFGMGIGHGNPKSIPVVNSDFIFSAISEEMGGIVAICLMLIYLSCFLGFINIAVKMKFLFYKLLACGITVMFMMQVILNIGGVTGFMPSTGVTLPLISQGGSSVIVIILMFSVIQGLYSINFESKNKKVTKHEKQKI